MAFITESSVYTTQIYLLETTDWVEGGLWVPGTGAGISNRQATELASRCKNTLDAISSQHLVTGVHPTANLLGWVSGQISDVHLDFAAAVSESKIALGFLGMPRPFGRGVYTSSAQMAADVLTASTSTTVDLTLITNTVNSTIATHNADVAAHPSLLTLVNTEVTEFNAEVKDLLISRVVAYSKLMNLGSGFLCDCQSSADAGAYSSGFQFVSGTHVFAAANGNSVPCVVSFAAPGGLSLGGNPTTAWCFAALNSTTALTIPGDVVIEASKDNGTTWTALASYSLFGFGVGQYLLHGFVNFPAPDTRLMQLRVTLATGVTSTIMCAGMFTNV